MMSIASPLFSIHRDHPKPNRILIFQYARTLLNEIMNHVSMNYMIPLISQFLEVEGV
jgi:hypothetical protein